MNRKRALIVGAGPAGLTAAYELLERTDIQPVLFEVTEHMGGLAKTVQHRGNRFDVGGHRFFSKSDQVMNWWKNILPLQGAPSRDDLSVKISYQGKHASVRLSGEGPDPEKEDRVMLVRNRLSRIFFMRKFFKYPLSLDWGTLRNLGILRVIRMGLSYVRTRLLPRPVERSLEDFFINRFGKTLYRTFFQSYTEKVWGVPCREIKPEWGTQRVKGLSIGKAVLHAFKRRMLHQDSLEQKDVETSLIEKFMYPKFGPGQLWEEVARRVEEKGGEVYRLSKVVGIKSEGNRIAGMTVQNLKTGEIREEHGDYFFSSMPVKELIECLGESVPQEVGRVARGLSYRSLVMVGLVLRKWKMPAQSESSNRGHRVPDNWIYIQEKDVKVSRLQIFNNWSPYMVKDESTVVIGLEYFCDEGDELWNQSDAELVQLAIHELEKIDFIAPEDVLDRVVIRAPKAYPGYFGSYDEFHVIREFTDRFENLFLIGRNGMHRYNNQDHSMLSAMAAVENIVAGITTKENVWSAGTESDYLEEK